MRTRRVIARSLALLLLSGCSAAEGTVLRRKNPGEEPSGDASTTPLADGSVSPPPPRDVGSQAGVGDCKVFGGQGFVEQFTGPALDTTRWLMAHGNEPMLGEASSGGFVRENVRIEDNKLVLTVHGDLYQGSVRGFAADGTRRSDGKRTGAAIATRNLFQSATYQWEGRLSSEPGVKLVLAVRRAPVDESALALSAPGLDGATRSYGFVEALLAPGSTPEKRYQLRVATRLDDGNPQSLRFDWHSGGPGISHYYTDFQDESGSLLNVQDPQPARAGRLWLVAFVPDGAPANFDSAEVRIETAFITPFAEGGDACTNGELPPGILVAP